MNHIEHQQYPLFQYHQHISDFLCHLKKHILQNILYNIYCYHIFYNVELHLNKNYMFYHHLKLYIPHLLLDLKLYKNYYQLNRIQNYI